MKPKLKITTIKIPLPLSIQLETLRIYPKESKANVISRILNENKEHSNANKRSN
jgi:hypothetical protein